MRLLFFVPHYCESAQRIKKYNSAILDAELEDAVYALEEVFLSKRRVLCKQTSWMGRSCFTEGNKSFYLMPKGIGPSPGSEQFRLMLDKMMVRRAEEFHGGCLRLNNGAFYPLIVQFVQNGEDWEIIDPRPEGFSMFGLLYREAEAGSILNALKIPTPIPLLLLRNKLESPWKPNSRTSLEKYLKSKLPEALSSHLYLPLSDCEQLRFNIKGLAYLDMDAGILIRACRSPYRIANLHTAVVENERDTLEFLTKHMLSLRGMNDISEKSIGELSEKFVCELAATTAQLFCEGIIHGQLHIHYQNISLAGEIADLDSLVFVNSGLEGTSKVPFPKSRHRRAYLRFRAILEEADEKFGTRTAHIMYRDFKHIVRINYGGLDKPRLVSYMLRQIYDVYTQAIRTADILYRNFSADLRQMGTVLSKNQLLNLQTCFADTFNDSVREQKGGKLLTWCLRHGIEYLLKRLLYQVGNRTLYGWDNPNVPLNHLEAVCNSERQSFINQHAENFYKSFIKLHHKTSSSA